MSNGTEIHNMICKRFRDTNYSKEFIEKYTAEGCSKIIKIILEDIISNNNILIGYCDVVIDYEDNDGKQQKVLIEVKSSAEVINKDPLEVLRQIKKYRFYNKNFTKSFLIYNSDDSNVYFVDDDDLFTEEDIIVVAINVFEHGFSNKKGDIWTEPFTGMEFVWVPGGQFMMGSDSEEAKNDEQPVHEVRLDGFWIGKYPVTQAQWQKITENTPARIKFGVNFNFPLVNVSWDEAKKFISWMNHRSDQLFALPTEAQWEYSAKSGGNDEIYAGGNDVDAVAWYDKNSRGKTHRVGTKAPNGLGIYDMCGNVWEWCEDVYEEDAYSKHVFDNPVITGGKASSARVIRGGSWFNLPRIVRTASRDNLMSNDRNYLIGFRLSLSQVRHE